MDSLHGHYNLTDKSTRREKSVRYKNGIPYNDNMHRIYTTHTPISHHQILKRFHLDIKWMHERVVIAKTNVPFLNSKIITHT